MDTDNQSEIRPESSSSDGAAAEASPPGPPQPPAWAKSKANVARPNIDAWFKFDAPGAAIDGVMAFHGLIARDGRQQRIFIIRDSARKGYHWGVGERSGLVGLRRVPIGSRVWIQFTGRRETGNVIDGEKQTIMLFDVRPEHLVDRDIPAVASSSGGGGGGYSPGGTPPGSDDDIPF